MTEYRVEMGYSAGPSCVFEQEYTIAVWFDHIPATRGFSGEPSEPETIQVYRVQIRNLLPNGDGAWVDLPDVLARDIAEDEDMLGELAQSIRDGSAQRIGALAA